ncbi:hypothetical protein K505DRAFT_333921 [Melanomma pulvis-pyrius CBS 109.77]|uniref:DUF6594 domain-containing protein n=1 Tax=Melanomma pulvis-pyrius CBS 109.77 TaxID=1314802 RepID=A0A6A6XMZ0_9PLEO|nr:hypothetical protein K505DRAFT_333921 [Melanomma pulvis-pyrius CBS 109.77]
MQASQQAAPGATPSSRQDFLLALKAHRDLFDDIDNNRPEADIRRRFLGYRAIRAAYVGYRVREKLHRYDEFESEITVENVNLKPESTWKTFEKIMMEVDETLTWYSRIYEEDTRAAQAPVVSQFYMDRVFRHHTAGEGKGLLAPNGELLSLYGTQGEPVPMGLAPTRGYETDLLRHIILETLLIPFHSYIYIPCWKIWSKILNRDPGPEPEALSGRTLEIVVTAVECMISVLFLAGPVVLLYNLPHMRDRVIAGSFFSLTFPLILVFLSKEARGIFILNAAFWAIIAIFIVANGSGPKYN